LPRIVPFNHKVNDLFSLRPNIFATKSAKNIYGNSYNKRNLDYYKRFYLLFPDLQIVNMRVHKDANSYLAFFYNPDMITALGYRVRSITATRFRQWAD
jgi:hypothetical protein